MPSFLRLLLPVLICCCFGVPVRSAGTAGGELGYTWLHDSTYRVYLNYYRECDGLPAPDTFRLCYRYTCSTPATAFTTLLQKDTGSNDAIVNLGWCSNIPTTCADPQSNYPGFRKCSYSAVVVLPFRCSEWAFSVVVSSRVGSTNLTGTGDAFFEATLNNADAQGNSSPAFAIAPLPVGCFNNNFFYHSGTSDANNDSLRFALVAPRNSSGSNCNNAPLNAMYLPPYSVYQPMPGALVSPLDNETGSVSLASLPLQGRYAFAILVTEYRNGIKVGSVVRDLQLQSRECNSMAALTINVLPSSLVNCTFASNRIYAAPGQPFSFCFRAASPSVNSVLYALDNSSFAMPGSYLQYTGTQTNVMNGCLSWTPPPAATSVRILTVSIRDTTCGIPGGAASVTWSIPVQIGGANSIGASQAKQAGVRIYPNPTSCLVHIEAARPVNFTLTTTDGRQAMSGKNTTRLDITSLTAGLYFLHIYDAKSGTLLKTEKLVKAGN